MTRFIQIASVISFLVLAPQHLAADDLFSEVAIGSVFGGKSPIAKSGSSAGATETRRITGATSLQRTLEKAEISAEELESNSVVAELSAPGLKDGKLKAVLIVNVDKSQIVVGVPLVKIDEAKVSSSKLLQMLDSGRNSEAITFAYSASDNWIGIRRTLSDTLSPTSLNARLNEIVAFAQNTSDLWTALEASSESDPPQQPKSQPAPKVSQQPQPAPRSTAPQKLAFVGTWRAGGTQGTSYQLEFNGNNFKLTITTNGQVSSSSGAWSFSNGRLTLTGEGITLSGTVKAISASKFQLTLNNLAPLEFTKS